MSDLLRALFGATLALLACAGCGDGERPLSAVANGRESITGRGVLVIVVDGLRWDHTSLAGYDRDTTPFLTRFAREGTVFEDAWSPTASRLGAHVAILTGCDPALARPPHSFGAEPGGASGESESWFLPASLDLLGQSFLGGGWTTAAFVDDPLIAEVRGFDRGFREFIEYGGDADEDDGQIGVYGVGRRFVQWLYDQPLEQDWFAYVHLDDLRRVWADREEESVYRRIDSRDSWTPRPDLSGIPPIGIREPMLHALPRSLAAVGDPISLGEYELRYDRGIRAIDASLDRLIAYAEDYGRAELLTVVIAGSHGMALGERGLYLQTGQISEADLRVPLLVRPARDVREGLGWTEDSQQRRAGGVVSLADLAPTLVDLMGLRSRAGFQGVSLVPMLRDAQARARSRVFLNAPTFGERGFVDEDSIFIGGGASQETRQSRSGGGGSTADEILKGSSLLDAWGTLQMVQRRALHYGLGSTEGPSRQDLFELQVKPD